MHRDDEGERRPRVVATPAGAGVAEPPADEQAGRRSRPAAAAGSERRAWSMARLSPSARGGRRPWSPERRRKMATMMPRPTTTSAAATTRTKNTATWPPMSSSMRENVTKVRFTALSISSMHMNMTRTLRRISSPTAPMLNSTAASTRYQAAGRSFIGPAHLGLVRTTRSLRASLLAPGPPPSSTAPVVRRAQDAPRHHGDDEQRRGDLEGEEVGGEDAAAELRRRWHRRLVERAGRRPGHRRPVSPRRAGSTPARPRTAERPTAKGRWPRNGLVGDALLAGRRRGT